MASETWATKAEDVRRLLRAERAMVRRMCGVTFKDTKSSQELMDRLGVYSGECVVLLSECILGECVVLR